MQLSLGNKLIVRLTIKLLWSRYKVIVENKGYEEIPL